MFASTKAAKGRVARVEAYPRFGGRLVPQGVNALLIALSLAGASAGATLTAVSLAAPAQAEAVRQEAPAKVMPAEVRTTGKADRLKPAFKPLTCDGVWGNEPLECLLQTA